MYIQNQSSLAENASLQAREYQSQKSCFSLGGRKYDETELSLDFLLFFTKKDIILSMNRLKRVIFKNKLFTINLCLKDASDASKLFFL